MRPLLVSFQSIKATKIISSSHTPFQISRKAKMLSFGGNLGYRLRPETVSPLFADLSSTTHI